MANVIRSCATRALLFNKASFKPIVTLPAALNKIQSASIQTSAIRNDIDSAAKYIGAGAATVGVAGAGKTYDKKNLKDFCFLIQLLFLIIRSWYWYSFRKFSNWLCP